MSTRVVSWALLALALPAIFFSEGAASLIHPAILLTVGAAGLWSTAVAETRRARGQLALAWGVLGLVMVVEGFVNARELGPTGMLIPGGAGIFLIGYAAWLVARGLTRPVLGNQFLSEDEVRERLADQGATGTRLRRVDRTYLCSQVDTAGLDRALADGECLRAPAWNRDPWDPDRPSGPDSLARAVVWTVDGRPCLVVAWWINDDLPAYDELQAAAYLWDDEASHGCEAALDEVGNQLGAAWRAKRTEVQSDPWQIPAIRKSSRGEAR